ncbi:MAG: tyrosine-type recombinase/integrase [Pyrinomonadaceae bacterium]
MAVYKRFKGKRIGPKDPNWDQARWWMEFRLRSERVFKAIPGARTKAQAERAEINEKESIYDRRFNKGKGKDVGFTQYVDESYLPWARKEKASYADDERRSKTLKSFFRDRPLRDINTVDVERLKSALVGKVTNRKTPRKGATVNRYVSLLSRVFSRAHLEGLADSNPCHRIPKEQEGGRERYLTHTERPRLLAAMVNDLAYLRSPIEVSLGTGIRKVSELLKLRIGNINFGALPIFRSAGGNEVEILPNWFLLADTKNKRHRLLPMNALVRAALLEVTRDRPATDPVFAYERTGVSKSTLRDGFQVACNRAGIVYGQTKPGGLTWHDLRRTFATGLRANNVHEYDIAQLLGHSIPAVTSTYARSTPAALQAAVDTLEQPWGDLVRFERKVG